ncbi:manganese and iron superoxide dismutase [Durotheca rogersii]|uniref:manganese and iron superoxide dismutase n=1 Tax=Durotheca rogersii TaxID=419775 RepID=UPI00221EBFCE|nr:manganese and iron superoxide dismutase [Durotheca rogersii]KAI5861770.1 manganese and iron superoxide dismutase [Durotheca rogersii]
MLEPSKKLANRATKAASTSRFDVLPRARNTLRPSPSHPAAMLRPRLRIPRPGRLWRPAPASRSLHQVPVLGHIDAKLGVPGLLSPGGFDMAWTQYMQFVLERLNALIAGTELASQETLTIIKSTAREPSKAAIFNYASMAHNNAMFFENIVGLQVTEAGEIRDVPDEQRIPHRLLRELTMQFSSIETLRQEFLVTALAMFGPGFVWLVKNGQSSDLRILVTYLAGTPYTAAHWRRQGVDMNTQGTNSPDTVTAWLERTKTGAGADNGAKFVTSSEVAPGGTDVIPLLCLNTWEHVWLRDYGIGAGDRGGKRQYVENWWRCINWENVESLANLGRPTFRT